MTFGKRKFIQLSSILALLAVFGVVLYFSIGSSSSSTSTPVSKHRETTSRGGGGGGTPSNLNDSASDSSKIRALLRPNPTSFPSRPTTDSASAGSEKIPPLTGTKGSLIRGSKSTPLSIVDSLSSRVFLKIDEAFQISLNLTNLRPGERIFISAPDGGDLSRADGQPLVHPASATSEKLFLNFKTSIGRGAYTIGVSHGGESFTIDLWAGERNPIGQPGAAYIPSSTP